MRSSKRAWRKLPHLSKFACDEQLIEFLDYWSENLVMKKIILATLLLSTASSAFAHDSVIRAGSVLNVENGAYATDQYIIIEDGKISEIGSWDDLDVDGEFIDLSDKYILPGLSDAHVHLTGDASVHGYKRLTRSVQFPGRPLQVLGMQKERLMQVLQRFGMLALRVMRILRLETRLTQAMLLVRV